VIGNIVAGDVITGKDGVERQAASSSAFRESMKKKINWDFLERFGVAAEGRARLKSSIVTLAYIRARTLDPSGRVSDKDLANAIQSLGADAQSVPQFRAGLERFMDTAHAQFMSEYDTYKLGYGDPNLGDPAQFFKGLSEDPYVPTFNRPGHPNYFGNPLEQPETNQLPVLGEDGVWR